MRRFILDCELTEELKWDCACYTFEKSNIVLIRGFKEYCAFLFFKGALLKDAMGIVIQQTENMQAVRQIRFTPVREIVKMEPVMKAYILHFPAAKQSKTRAASVEKCIPQILNGKELDDE